MLCYASSILNYIPDIGEVSSSVHTFIVDCIPITEMCNNNACWWVSQNALFWKSQTHSFNDNIKDFDQVFLGIPVKNCGNVVNMPYSNDVR